MARRNLAGRRGNTPRGFSIIEAMIAMIVIALVVLAMGSITPYAFSQIQVNSTQAQAVAVAQQMLDAQRNSLERGLASPTPTTVPIDQGDSFLNNGSANNASGNFSVTPDACPQTTSGQFSNQHTCTVSVTWTEDNQAKSLTVQSIVTK